MEKEEEGEKEAGRQKKEGKKGLERFKGRGKMVRKREGGGKRGNGEGEEGQGR